MYHSPKTRVIVVDDESSVSTTLVAILNAKGFEAAGYTSPIAALEALDVWQPDVVISDVIMPEMNGIELSLQIKTRYPETQIILFSGQAATSDLLADAQLHGHEFTVLAKPVHPDFLMSKVRELAVPVLD